MIAKNYFRSLFLLFIVLFNNSNAQTPYLLKDVNQGTASAFTSYERFYKLNNKILFSALDGGTRTNLYATTGTSKGTVKLANVYVDLGSLTYLFQYGNKLFFPGYTNTYGTEPWVTDGTPQGTFMLKDLNPGNLIGGGTIGNYFVFNNQVHFVASLRDSASNFIGEYLIRTDGTSAGTVIVDDFCSTASCTGALSKILVQKIIWQKNGYFYFVGSDTTSTQLQIRNNEIWMSDGSSSPITKLKEIYPGITSSDPFSFYEYNNNLYFFANDPVNGSEPWKTDGTTTGTGIIKNIMFGSTASSICPSCDNFFEVNGNLLFGAHTSSYTNNELWKTDGTNAGTTVLKEIGPGAKGSLSFNTAFGPQSFKFNNKLIFAANDSTHGTELWITDGTGSGTQLLKDINPDTAASISVIEPQYMHVFKNNIYFSANDGTHGNELWKSDGTSAGTTLVKDILQGSGSGLFKYLDQGTDKIFFSSNDSIHGEELWETDGATGGTKLIKDLFPGTFDGCCYTGMALGKILYFSNSGYPAYFNSAGVGKSDGSGIGTSFISNQISEIHKFYRLGNYILFTAFSNAAGRELWVMSTINLDPKRTGEFSSEPGLISYPNPTTGNTRFDFTEAKEGNYKVQVSDIFGKEILMKEISMTENENFFELDLSNYKDGIYIVVLSNENMKETTRVVKITN